MARHDFQEEVKDAFSEPLHALPQMHLKWGQLDTIVGFFVVVFSSD